MKEQREKEREREREEERGESKPTTIKDKTIHIAVKHIKK